MARSSARHRVPVQQAETPAYRETATYRETALQRAKHPRTALAGPYGHPFHPMLVTIPIGTWVASIVFDIVAIVADDPSPFAMGAVWLIGIGIVGALLAAVFGFIDLSGIEAGTATRRVAVTHMSLNLAIVVLFAVSFIIRTAMGADEFTVAGFVISLIAIAMLGASGWLGGELAYRHGVRVIDEQTQLQGFEQRAG